MSKPTVPPFEWTYDEYARFPDDGDRYEVINGEVCVTPAPGRRHQKIAANLYTTLDAYVRRYGLGEMYWDVDLLFVDGEFLRPDMLFVPAADVHKSSNRGVETAPGLVVEVLSPHSSHIDRVKKPPRYRDFRVPEYWVVDPDARAVEVYRLRDGMVLPEISTAVVRWQPEHGVPALDVAVPDLFPDV